MKPKGAWAVQSLAICIVCNAVFAAMIFMMSDKILSGFGEWLSPFVAQGGPALPGEVHSALAGLMNFVVQLHGYLLPILAVLAAGITLLLWLCVFSLGLRLVRRSVGEAALCRESTVQGQISNPALEKQ